MSGFHAALVVPICESGQRSKTIYTLGAYIRSALVFACALRITGSNLTLVALTHGLSHAELTMLHRGGFDRVINATDEPLEFAHLYRPERGTPSYGSKKPLKMNAPRRWPRVDSVVQNRPDGGCTSLKLHAWRMVDYLPVVTSDADVLFTQPPDEWVRRYGASHFIATHEPIGRGYIGLNSHLMMFHPSVLVHQILAENAASGGFIPFTNGEQDVIEGVYAAHRWFPDPPGHLHGNLECAPRRETKVQTHESLTQPTKPSDRARVCFRSCAHTQRRALRQGGDGQWRAHPSTRDVLLPARVVQQLPRAEWRLERLRGRVQRQARAVTPLACKEWVLRGARRIHREQPERPCADAVARRLASRAGARAVCSVAGGRAGREQQPACHRGGRHGAAEVVQGVHRHGAPHD